MPPNGTGPKSFDYRRHHTTIGKTFPLLLLHVREPNGSKFEQMITSEKKKDDERRKATSEQANERRQERAKKKGKKQKKKRKKSVAEQK